MTRSFSSCSRPRAAGLATALGALVSLGVSSLIAQQPTQQPAQQIQTDSVPGAASVAPAIPTQPITLGDAIRFAARNSATAQTAQLRVAASQAQIRQARSSLLPQLSATGSTVREDINTATFGITFPTQPGQPPLFNPNGQVTPPFTIVDYRGKVDIPVLDLASIVRVHAAETLARSTQSDATDVSEQAGTNAAVAYIRALRAEDQLRARNADSVLAADLLNIAQQQLQAGVGIALDVTRAQAQLAGTRAQLIASRNTYDRSKLDLLRALGLPLATQLTLHDSLETLNANGLTTDETAAIAQGLAARPDLRAAQQRIDAAKQSVSAIKMERLPTVALFGNDGGIGKNYKYLLNTYQYGVQISLPIFDGFRREGRIEEQSVQLREAEIRAKDLRDQAEADIRGALLDLASAREQVDATRERLRLADQEVSQARERFRAGVAGNADVITASLSLTDARTAAIDALTNYQAARVALARAEGSVTTLP